METEVETQVTPTCLVKNNIIICQKHLDPRQMSEQLEQDVMNIQNEFQPTAGVIYALKLDSSNIWSRAVVKFQHDDGTIVIQSIDMRGIFDFKPGLLLRRIQSPALKSLKPSIFKLMIYGIYEYQADEEFTLIFDQTIKNRKTVIISRLMEQRENITKQCYVGDILFFFKNQYRSFREILIRERISSPALVSEKINQQIFQIRTQFLLNQNGSIAPASTLRFVESVVTQNQDDALVPIDELSTDDLIDGKFWLNQIIGEGHVSN